MSATSQPVSFPTHLVSVDAEATRLHGHIFAIGACLYDIDGLVPISTFTARISEGSPDWRRVTVDSNDFVRDNILPKMWDTPWMFHVQDERSLLCLFMAWWLSFKSGPDRVSLAAVECMAKMTYLSGLPDNGEQVIGRAVSDFWDIGARLRARERYVPMTIADHGHPIEHTMFDKILRAFSRYQEFDMIGPNPLHEVATMRAMFDMSERRRTKVNIQASIGDLQGFGFWLPYPTFEHNPLVDAALSAISATKIINAIRENDARASRWHYAQIAAAVGQMADCRDEDRRYYLGKIDATIWLANVSGIDLGHVAPPKTLEEVESFKMHLRSKTSAELATADTKPAVELTPTDEHSVPVLRWSTNEHGESVANICGWDITARTGNWALIHNSGAQVLAPRPNNATDEENRRAAENMLRSLGVPFRVDSVS